MKQISVQVRSDFLQRLTHVTPLLAVEELIWNSLDADATEVHVSFELSEMDGIMGLTVQDNGTGIVHAEIAQTFGNLGGSAKKDRRQSQVKGRILHGKAGRGRLRSFKLGRLIEWKTRYGDGLMSDEYSILGNLSDLETFQVTSPHTSVEPPGTTVIITDVTNNLSSLLSNTARETLTQHLAPYLVNYPDAQVWYNSYPIDPDAAIRDKVDLDLGQILLSDGSMTEAELSIYEWKASTEPSFVLCDENGFPRHSLKAGMPGLGYDFTAYLKSSALRQLDEDNVLTLDEMDEDIKRLVDRAREEVRSHFRQKTALASVNFVQQWKKEHVYPFLGEAKSPVETAERQIFDVLALALNTYLPGFQKSNTKQQQFAMRLLRHAVETGPSEVLTIMKDVLDLPADKQVEMSRLLERTTLTAIINATKVISDRQNFLRSLVTLLSDPEAKGKLLERNQLHKILENETWIFGEEYHLTVSDQSLTQVLESHLALLGPRCDAGSDPFVDLMLSRLILHPQSREHLIVDLKRPTQVIDDQVLRQIENYARAVAGDMRLKDTNTQWTFWIVSNEITDTVHPGLAFEDDPIKVWVKTWGQVIDECKTRLAFYAKNLEYNADDASALEYLNRTHSKYLPANLKVNT